MAFTLLYVCTGNICRSPLAERYTVHRLVHAAPDLAHLVRVRSAGTRGLEGYPMDALAEAELVRHGGLGDGFVGHRLTSADAGSAQLVLTMERAQRAEVLAEEPAALRRTFTLLEAADLAQLVGTDGQLDAVPAGPMGLVAAMMARRSAARIDDYDVADPIGESPEVHAAVAVTITTAVDVLIDALVPSLRQLVTTAEPGS